MRRHVKTVHADFKDDDMIDDNDRLEKVEDDKDSDSGDANESSLQSDTDDYEEEEAEEEEIDDEAEEVEEDEDSDDPWRLLIQEVFKRCQSEFDERVDKHMVEQGIDEEEARKKVYHNMLPIYRKALANVFVDEILWFEAMKRDRIYLAMKNTVSDLKLVEDYDTEEAWKSAVNKRKFLLDRVIKEYDPPELSDPREYDDGQKQRETTSKVNNDQEGGSNYGSEKLKVNLVSPTEQIALRAKEELLREGRKRGLDGFTSEDKAEIERMKQRRRSGAPWTIIQNV